MGRTEKLVATPINMMTPKAKPSQTKKGILKSAFIIISFELYPTLSINTDARRATENGESLIQAGKLQNPQHRVADMEQGKRFSVFARSVMGLDENGGAGAVDRGNRGHVYQQVISAGQGSEEHPPGLPGMVNVDRANDTGDSDGRRLGGPNGIDLAHHVVC